MTIKREQSNDGEYTEFIIVQHGVEMRLKYRREATPKLSKAKVRRMLSEIITTLAINITKEQE